MLASFTCELRIHIAIVCCLYETCMFILSRCCIALRQSQHCQQAHLPFQVYWLYWGKVDITQTQLTSMCWDHIGEIMFKIILGFIGQEEHLEFCVVTLAVNLKLCVLFFWW